MAENKIKGNICVKCFRLNLIINFFLQLCFKTKKKKKQSQYGHIYTCSFPGGSGLWERGHVSSGKKPPDNAGDVRDTGLIPGSGRSPGGGHGHPLQYSCLENPNRGAWWATVHGVAKLDTTEVT